MARTFLIALAATIGMSTPAVGDDHYVVTLEAQGTYVTKGLVYGQTDTVADGGVVARPGEAGTAFLSFHDQPSGEVCNHASGSTGSVVEARNEFLLPNTELFTATVRPLGAKIGKVRFEVAWERHHRGAVGPGARVGGDVRTVEMPEGEFHALDFLQGHPTADSSCYSNVVIGVRGRIKEDEQFAGVRFGYDVWWRHTDAQGRVENRRFVGTGLQGERVGFNLGERRELVPEAKDGKHWESILEVSGEVQARAKADGRIELRLGAGRWIDTEPAGTPRRGGIGDGGRKLVTVTSGETIALRLPTPGGRTEFVDSRSFYAGHTDELILTVTREK
jgi:hypothetical protein